MRQSHVLFSALHFFLLTALCLCGIVTLLLFFSPIIRYQFSSWIAKDGYELLWIGIVIVFSGLLLFVLSTRLYKAQYYQVKMGFPSQSAEVDLDVVRSLAGRYWQNNFPSVKPQVDVLLRDDTTLELFVELPLLSSDEHQALLQKIETDLSRQLARHLG